MLVFSIAMIDVYIIDRINIERSAWTGVQGTAELPLLCLYLVALQAT